MVGVPGKYKGCETCRARRVKCDNQRPQCKKCLDSGRECAGYQRDIVFITATVEDAGRCSSHPPRRVPSARRTRTNTPETPRIDLRVAQPFRPAWECGILLTNLGDLCQLKVVVLHTKLGEVQWDDGGDVGKVKLRLPPFKPRDFRNEGFLQVVSVESRLLVHLDTSRSVPRQSTLLFLSEPSGSVSSGSESLVPTQIPSSAAGIRALGPQNFRHFPAHHYFVRVFRHTSAMMSLLTRQPTFLSLNEWRITPWEVHEKSPLDHLLDIVVLLPALFHRADIIMPAQPALARRLEAQTLLSDCLTMEAKLDYWHSRLQSNNTPTSTSAYWAQDPSSPSTLLATMQIPFSDNLVFKDGPTALSLLTYWTALLLLHSAIDDIHAAICTPILDDYSYMYPDLPLELRIDINRYRQRRDIAGHICRGLDFALGAGVQLDALDVPLAVATGVYREINETSRDGELEVQWCERFREAMAGKGQELAGDLMARSWTSLSRL
ncbi:hypothetical protein F5X68DRAFT_10120 [Plectosphaerella plurivora]|uniref:Zn(2)-C6 fungal-type domain-containing protein n=1 Tax=Plectosphaerella plurivora TaxID=936078 RepID=A0A9P8VDQ1_9PEZI|nr:hypothetical protein F5X68DRAFT_10120 [Plectosphaerella plurivora]